MKKLFLLLVAVLSVALCSSAQTRVVTGTVVDGDNEPVYGASVVAGTNKQGVATDVDGAFAIQVPTGVNTLHVSYVGLKPATVQIPANNKVYVQLLADNNLLGDVIVVAYGKTTRAEYTGSAGVVSAAQLEDALTSNVTNAISGKVAGVQTLSSNGQPGTGSTVLIRGVGSINASTSPLYVVDGMPFDGDISTIANSDIESMTVLKDAASAALYGARGANGVILITTKKGSSGSAKVTVDMRWGSNSRALPNYDVISDARQYLELIYRAHYQTAKDFYGLAPAYDPENKDQAAWAADYNRFYPDAHAYANSQIWPSIGYQTWTIPAGQDIVGTDGKFNPYATPGYKSGNFYYLADDWTKGTLSDGLRQEYNVAIQGGNDKFNYYVSGSYLGDDGIIANSHFNRFSSRANVDYQAKKWLKIGTNISYAYTNSGYPGDQTLDYSTSTGNAFNLVNSLGPVYPLYIRTADGQIAWNKQFNRPIYDYGSSSYVYEGLGRTPSRNTYSSSNPASDLVYNKEEYLADVLDAKWYAVLTPLDGLTVSATAGYMVDNTRNHYLANSLYGQSSSYKGQVSQAASRYRTINLQALASYNKTFADKHNIDLMVGFENQSYNEEGVWAIGSNLYNPGVWVVDNTIDDIRGGGNVAQLVHRGFFARAKYTLDQRYFFMGSIRRDASSRFAPSHRWGTFWSLSAGWDIAKENFVKNNTTVIDMLKLKASFGQNGNDGIGSLYLAYPDIYRITGADGVWSDGQLYKKGNPDITWETSNNFNAGFDFSFFKKLSGTIEYFQRQTTDMLFNVPTAPSLGYSSMPMNVGSMRNSGVEIDLNYTVFNSSNFTWDLFANITFGWNKVLKLDPRILNTHENWRQDSPMGWLSGSRMFLEGQSMYNLWLVEYAGVDSNTGQALYWALRDKVDAEGNKIEYLTHIDDNGHKIVDQYEQEEYLTDSYTVAYNTNRKATGNLMPKAYGGFGTNIQVYGFDLGLQFAYQFGGRIIDSAYQTFMSPASKSGIGQNYHKDLLNAWSYVSQETDVPRLAVETTGSAANSTSTRFLTSSNYVSLNNVTLGYTLPAKWSAKAGLSSVRVYGSAENVALWSKRKGLDPRQGFTSSDNSTYSPIRTIAGGIKVSF